MNLFVTAREVLRGIHAQLDASLNLLVLAINVWAGKEHNPDGTHAAITATTISGTTLTVTAVTFNGTTQTTVGAAGGASALPATPLGYMVQTVTINGTATEVVVPYFVKA